MVDTASRLQCSITNIKKLISERGFQLSADKSIYVIFIRKSVKVPPLISINRQNVKYVTKHKFLSLIFDSP